MKLALKVDVDTYRGTREGVPRLLRLLERHGVGASFFFSLGPDHTGRALRRALRPGFFSKLRRTSVVRHYGLRTLLYGTLLPAPDVGRRCANEMRAVRAAGFDAGIHCWDHVRWHDVVASRDAHWTEREMWLAEERFHSIFGAPATSWASAGWQTNAHAAARQGMRFHYASDTRGALPFLPVWNGRQIGCVQLPTTLPTLDELIGRPDIDPVPHLLSLTAAGQWHVFTAHAELEGGVLAGMLEALLAGWKAQGYDIASLAGLRSCLDVTSLPLCEVTFGEVPGRAGAVALQGRQWNVDP
jgi:undecaprenyl phosphate-alpha-L-ara4FN deformylase